MTNDEIQAMIDNYEAEREEWRKELDAEMLEIPVKIEEIESQLPDAVRVNEIQQADLEAVKSAAVEVYQRRESIFAPLQGERSERGALVMPENAEHMVKLSQDCADNALMHLNALNSEHKRLIARRGYLAAELKDIAAKRKAEQEEREEREKEAARRKFDALMLKLTIGGTIILLLFIAATL